MPTRLTEWSWCACQVSPRAREGGQVRQLPQAFAVADILLDGAFASTSTICCFALNRELISAHCCWIVELKDAGFKITDLKLMTGTAAFL